MNFLHQKVHFNFLNMHLFYFGKQERFWKLFGSRTGHEIFLNYANLNYANSNSFLGNRWRIYPSQSNQYNNSDFFNPYQHRNYHLDEKFILTCSKKCKFGSCHEMSAEQVFCRTGALGALVITQMWQMFYFRKVLQLSLIILRVNGRFIRRRSSMAQISW